MLADGKKVLIGLATFCLVLLSNTESLNIVDQRSLQCYSNRVEFTLAENASVFQIDTANGRCSKPINGNNTVTFYYEECGAEIDKIDPYGPVTILKLVAFSRTPNKVELTTQCFFEDIIDTNSTFQSNVGFVKSEEIKEMFIIHGGNSTKYARLGENISITIEVAEQNYKAMLPLSCRFFATYSNNANDGFEIQIFKDGCPKNHKIIPFIFEHLSPTKSTFHFSTYRQNSSTIIRLECPLIVLCRSSDNPVCQFICNTNESSSNKSSLISLYDGNDHAKIVRFSDAIQVIVDHPNIAEERHGKSQVIVWLLTAMTIISLAIACSFCVMHLYKRRKTRKLIERRFLNEKNGPIATRYHH